MFSRLVSIVNDIALSPQSRQVKSYLDTATCESVLRDFGKILSSQLTGFREREHLQTTFDNYCKEDETHQKYWNEESFRQHIRVSYSEAVISDVAVQILWRSFHYYAYHPFPRGFQHDTIDFDAFRRAALLTVFQCDDLLGRRELDWFWREDAAFFRRSAFERVMKSIAVPRATPSAGQTYSDSAVSDTMDVLIMVGPQFMHAAPSPQQLEPVAKRLLASCPATAQREVDRSDLATLMSLLLRLRLKKAKWGSYCHAGTLFESSPTEQEVVESMVKSLTQGVNGQTISSAQLVEVMHLIPNFQLRFSQLWAVLFQPASAGADEKLPTTPVVPLHINGAIALFAPLARDEGPSRASRKDLRLLLQPIDESSDQQDSSANRLIHALSEKSGPQIVLFSQQNADSSPLYGAYLPASLSDKAATDSKGDDDVPFLFQLSSAFQLIRWGGSGNSLAESIHLDGGASLAEITTGHTREAYSIGNAEKHGPRIEVSPANRCAVFVGHEGSKVLLSGLCMDIFSVTTA